MKRQLEFLRRHEFISIALLLSIILCVVFYQVILGDRTLMFSARSMASVMPYGAFNPTMPVKIELPIRSPDPAAPAWQTDAWVAFMHNEVFNQHVFPLWNPFNGWGMPFLANMQSQPFFPPVWLPTIFPNPTAVDLFDLSRMLLAGVFTYAFLRLFFIRAASVVGSIAFMLTGYILLYLNMPEISATLSMPLIFYAFERLVRDTSARTIALCAIVSCLNLYGGMPESTALIMVFAGAYLLTRVVVLPRTNATKLKAIGGAAAGCALGLCLAAPQVLPFLEYMKQSFNVHDPALGVPVVGTIIDFPWWPNVLYYAVPFDLGSKLFLGKELFPLPVRGYVGVFVTFLTFVSASVLFRKSGGKTPRERMILQIVAFFFAATVFFLLKRFGFPLVNWLGYLPIMDMINFPKYDEPLIGFSTAALAAASTHLILKRRVQIVDTLIALGVIAGSFYFWKLQELFTQFPPPTTQHACALLYNVFIFSFFLFLGFAVSAAYLANFKSERIALLTRKYFPVAVVLVLLFDLTALGINPIFHRNKLPHRECNPYSGAPYISFLQKKTKDSFDRVMANDAFLFPSWSAAFGLFDIRALDALFVSRFFPFVRTFLYGSPNFPMSNETPPKLQLSTDNATSRFHGYEEGMQYPTELKPDSLIYKLYVLSSVRYVITEPLSQRLTPEMQQILSQNASKKSDFFGARDNFFAADGRRLHVVYQHPIGTSFEASRVTFKTTVPRDRPVFSFRVGLNFNSPAQGDGANAFLHLSDGTNTMMLFQKALDTVHGADFDLAQFDLTRFAGKPIVLQFSVDAGSKMHPTNDWVGWADVRFVKRGDSSSKYWPGANLCGFKPVYCAECAIFENPRVLPRAAVFSKVQLVSKESEALDYLRDHKFNVLSEVVVEDTSMTPEEKRLAEQFAKSGLGHAQGQKITRYSAHDVDIDVFSGGGVLMLNDTMYPGWTAFVDGKEVAIHRTDSMFRGVFVSAGRHEVKFKYEPKSFVAGIVLFAISAFSTVVLWAWRRKRGLRLKSDV